jgi:hypothetical protein
MELMALLAGLKADGKKIAAYGAPAKATTLMYSFGFTEDTIECIVDDNPLKQGMFSPGLHVPVVPSSRLYESSFDYVLILAWNFADAIIAKHERLFLLKTRFIVPLPDVRVVSSIARQE